MGKPEHELGVEDIANSGFILGRIGEEAPFAVNNRKNVVLRDHNVRLFSAKSIVDEAEPENSKFNSPDIRDGGL